MRQELERPTSASVYQLRSLSFPFAVIMVLALGVSTGLLLQLLVSCWSVAGPNLCSP